MHLETLLEDLANNHNYKNNDDFINIYITGGSQGAEYINEIPKIFENFPHAIKIKHQCGKHNRQKENDMNTIMLMLRFQIL